MADSARATGWRVSAASNCGSAMDNAVGGFFEWNVEFDRSYTGTRVTGAAVLNRVMVKGEIQCSKFTTPITPGTSGTSSITVTKVNSGATATISCANCVAGGGRQDCEQFPMTQRQGFEYDPGDTETLMPIGVS